MAVVAVGLAAATMAGSAPALAEGSWSSYIKEWGLNSESRRWTDNHLDRAATTVTLSKCNFYGDGGTDIGLFRDISFQPDAKFGAQVNICSTSNWGEMKTKGSYYFKKTSSGKLSATTVTTRY
ncbi:hypothetical protein [Streptomyces fradiae]|uniref:hypothetical protein n=1 Tax=Streptomyces fradiae TaxID=1906 RepID=UPI003985F56B